MSKHLAMLIEIGRRVLRWWIAELAALVPASLRKRLVASDALVLTLDSDAATLTHEIAGRRRDLGVVSLPPVTAATTAAARVRALINAEAGLRQRLTRGKLGVALRLPHDAALRTHLALPLAAEANLHQALLFQLDRRTPFSPESVHFSHRILARDAAARQIDVELAVVPRSVVADAVALAKSLGLAPSSVEIVAETPDGAPSGNLLPHDERARRRPATLIARAAMAAIALAAAVALYQPIHAAHERAAALQREVAASKDAADKARRLKDAVTGLADAAKLLTGAKSETPSDSELLYELTRALPDDTWLQELAIGNGEVRLVGFSASSSALIKLLGQSGLFAEPRFRSAVTQDPATGKERFEITAKIVKRAAERLAAGSVS